MIEIYVNEIRSCLKNRCYFAALSLSLMLPDICGLAEYPHRQVAERYITWYDDYIGKDEAVCRPNDNAPYLSGEVVYNLRNTFFHQGAPNVIAGKVKDPTNQPDRFTLILGDGSCVHTITLTLSCLDICYRDILVDVSFLCHSICETALIYYSRNREKFVFDFHAVPQEYLFGKESPLDQVPQSGDPIGAVLNEKLQSSGKTVQIKDNVTDRMKQMVCRAIESSAADEENAGSSVIHAGRISCSDFTVFLKCRFQLAQFFK